MGLVTQRRIAAEAKIMGRLAEVHARKDYQSGDAHLYRLMETIAAQGKLPAISWELYRAAYAERRMPVCAPGLICCA
jgi:hypothetical protein